MLRCPNCSGPLNGWNPALNTFVCSYCGGTITFDQLPPAEPAPVRRQISDPDPALTASIARFVVESFIKKTRIDIRKDKMAMERITEASRKAAGELAVSTSVEVNIPFLTADESGPKHLQVLVTKEKLGQ